jgi:hypothetical protein
MQPTISRPFTMLPYNGVEVPIYGSSDRPLFALNDIGNICGDESIENVSAEYRRQPYATWLYVADENGNALHAPFFTKMGLCNYLFTKTERNEHFNKWVLTIFDVCAQMLFIRGMNDYLQSVDEDTAGMTLSEKVASLEKTMKTIRDALV